MLLLLPEVVLQIPFHKEDAILMSFLNGGVEVTDASILCCDRQADLRIASSLCKETDATVCRPFLSSSHVGGEGIHSRSRNK